MTPWPSWYHPEYRKPAEIGKIISLCAEHFNLTVEAITGPCRKRAVAWPRHLAYLLAKRCTHREWTVIGRAFGGRDHSTIITGCREAEGRISRDPVWREHYSAIKMKVRGRTLLSKAEFYVNNDAGGWRFVRNRRSAL